MNYTIHQEDRSLLVIVDMVNGFLNEGALSDASIHRITPYVTESLQYYLKHDLPVLAFIDSHDEHAQEFESFPPHCLEGSSEAELIKELIPYQNKVKLLHKNSTNGFVQPDFLPFLQSLMPLDSIVITGCCTDICILQFVLSLKGWLNQHQHKIELIVPVNSVDTFHAPGHDKDKFNEMALTLMANAGIQLVDALEWR